MRAYRSCLSAFALRNKKKNEKYTCGQKQRKETLCIAHGNEQFYEGARGGRKRSTDKKHFYERHSTRHF